MPNLTLVVASPFYRDQCTVELRFDETEDFCEIWNDAGTDKIEIYHRHCGNPEAMPWQFDLDELIDALQKAKASMALNGPNRY